MATVPLFKCKRANCAVVGKSGTVYKFQGTPQGRYWTENPVHIKELTEMAKRGGAGVFIDDRENNIDTDAATPMEAMKRKIIQDYLAEQSKIKDVGNYSQSLGDMAKSVGGTDENILTGSALASQKNHAALTGQDSPALAAAKASLSNKK